MQYYKLLISMRPSLIAERYYSACLSFLQVRISAKIAGQAAKGLTWYHAICFLESSPSTSLESLSGWQSLPSADQVSLRTVAKGKAPSTENGTSSSYISGSLFALFLFFPPADYR